MRTKDRDRLKVLHEVKRGHLTQRGQQSSWGGVTDRWVRKLLVRVKQEGDRGVVQWLRGQESNRRLAGSLRLKAQAMVITAACLALRVSELVGLRWGGRRL